MVKIIRAIPQANFWNHRCQPPYGLRVDEIKEAVIDIYNFFYTVNRLLTDQGLGFLEHLVLGNTLSAIISELLVKNIAKHSATVVRNRRVGGHPDLLPRGRYPNDEVLKGEGIEVKTSKQPGGWQGHNPEPGWIMIFRYITGKEPDPPATRQPITFVQILAAELTEDDWGLAERKPESRRTRTTSIKTTGMHKLRINPIYQDPAYIVAPTKNLQDQYRALHATFQG